MAKEKELELYKLEGEAEWLLKEVRGTPPGVARDLLLKRVRQTETASSPKERAIAKSLKATELSKTAPE